MNEQTKKVIHALEKDGMFKVLKVINYENQQLLSKQEHDKNDLIKITILDLETTGLKFDHDEAISFAAINVTYDKSKKCLVEIIETIEQFREPSSMDMLTDFIQNFTGITPEKVKGKSFDVELMKNFIKDSDFLLSHNAKFDKTFLEKEMPIDKKWICTKDDINWQPDFGIESKKLEYILFKSGYFYDAHDALVDCFALVKLLQHYSSAGLVDKLIQMTERKLYNLYAYGAPFDVKEDLKSAGFKWNSKYKVWAGDSLTKDEVEDYLHVIKDLYPASMKTCDIETIVGNQRFEVY